MVKCQGLNDDGGHCGVDLSPEVKFCPECGTRVHKVSILEKPKDTVACPATDEGNPCNEELVQGKKFCISCGWKVNQSIFEPGSRVCGAVDGQGTRCTGVIKKHETICPICKSDKDAAPTTAQKDLVSSADSKSVDQSPSQSRHEGTRTEQLSKEGEPRLANPRSQSTTRTETAWKPSTEPQSQESEPPFTDPRSQSTSRTETNEKLGTEQSRSNISGKPFLWSVAYRDGTRSTPESSETNDFEGNKKDENTINKSDTVNQTLQLQKPLLSSVPEQHSAGQDPQTSGAKLKFLYSEGGAEGSPGEKKTKAEQGDVYEGFTQTTNRGDKAGSTVSNQLAPEVQGNTSDQTSQSSEAKLNILYGEGNDKAVSEVQSDQATDCNKPKQVADRFQSIINILQKNKNSSEDLYGEPKKRTGNDDHRRDTWVPPTFSLLGHGVHTTPGPNPKGDGAGSVEKTKPSPGLTEDSITGSGDGPTQKPMTAQDGQEKSDTASVPSGPIVQRPAENNSSTDSGSSQKGIFNFNGSSGQKTNAGVWRDPDERFGEESKTGEIKDDQLFGDNSSPPETSKELKPRGEALREPTLFSIVNESKQKSIHTSSGEPSEDLDPKTQDTASAVGSSDDESGSSIDEDEDNSLNQNEEDSHKKKTKDKKNSSAKSKREKKKERKKRKKEQIKKEKTIDDISAAGSKKVKSQKPDENLTSGRGIGKKSDTGSTNLDTDVDKVQASNKAKTYPDSSTKTQTPSVSSNTSTDKRSNTRTHSDCIKVVFHAVFSPSILNDAKGGAYLCLTLTNVPHIRMELVKQFNDGNEEFTASFQLPKHLVERGINYTYCVDNSAGHHQYIPELFYDTTSSSGSIGRYLRVPKKSLSTDTWHQFDGFVYGKLDSSFFKFVKKTFLGIDDHVKNMKADAEKLLKYQFEKFLLDLQQQAMTPEEFFEMVQFMMSGYTYVYQFRGRLWNSLSDFEMFAGKIFKQSIETKVKQTTNERLPEHLKIGTLISLIHAIRCYAHFDEKDEKNMETLCALLQLQPSNEEGLRKTVEEIIMLFPHTLKAVTNTLQLMSNIVVGKTENTCWLLVVPLLHFLWGYTTPYQRPSTETKHNDYRPVWWGVEEYKREQEYFAAKSSWNLGLAELLQKLAPLFEMDYLLPRTLMTVVKLANMPDIVKSRLFSPDLCVAKLYYYVKSKHLEVSDHKIVQNVLNEIYRQVLERASREQNGDPKETREQLQDDMYRLYAIGYDLLEAVLARHTKPATTVTWVAQVVLQALALFEEMKENKEGANTRSSSNKYARDSLVVFHYVRNQLVLYLNRNYTLLYNDSTACRDSLLVWDQMLCITMPSTTLQKGFQRVVREELEKKLATKMFDVILAVYCEALTKFGSVVEDILSTLAFKALEKGSIITTYGSQSQDDVKKRYAKLLSSVFEKHWKQMTEDQMFQEALKWTPFVHFVDMFYLEDQGKHLSTESGSQLTKATTAIENRMDQLVHGTILVKDHSVICANFERFEKLIRLMNKKDNRKMGPTYIRQLVDLRSKELQAFLNAYDLVTVLIDMCSRFEVKKEALERRHRSLQSLDDVQMIVLCKPGVLGDMMHPEEYKPVVTAFEISPEELDLLPQMKHCLNSVVFTTKWDRTGQNFTRQRQEMLSIAETFEHVWQPSFEWWISTTTKLQEGSMTFQEFHKLFGKRDYPVLKKEFSLMEQNGSWIKERLDQIKLFRDLSKCVEGARIILQVVNKYDLKGDFKPIQLITSVMSGTDIAMKSLDQSLEDTCSVLIGVDERHIMCLKEFINCDPLILWLKESMPSGLKELKVFVDLASISAGEGDIEIAKVRCLHSATTGYAPLIFNLTDDIGYKGFLEKCKMVWKELEADPNLPKKLHDTNREIEWLKTVKKAHGSVEVTSLAQTEAINSVGIYQVGRLPDQKWEQKPELKDVISLHVSEDENGARQRKLYHYDLLHDLQSRLMLVAGKAEKGKEDVDRFTMILDSVVRLANTYIKLVSSGCVLFSEWKAKFLCDRDRRACSFITFGIGDQLNTLKGRKATDDDDVSSIIPRIAKFMEKCYEQWLKYIAEKRDEYYELNYLTIDQMVILQRELVKVGTDEEPSKLIFPLLFGIKKDCSMADLVSAMKAAQREVESMDDLRIEEKSETSSEGEIEEGEDEAVFIREVMKTGYSEELAKRALRHFKADEIDDAVVWCMDHDEEDNDTDEAMDMEEGGKEPPTEEYKGWTDTPMSISTVTSELLATLEHINEEVRVDPLIKDLDKLWERFLTSISSSVSDYLSVEHLGLVLRYLADKETFTVKRNLIQSFKEGVPNLIICPQNDILNTVLTIYMNDRQQALPQPDEVLVCSSHTTLDQLDIFWRRAVFNQGDKIYCLANSDLLDYEVSDKGEQCLERHMQTAKEKGIKYKLVVLCSTENEYKSRIVAALERFRRPQLPVANQQLIQSYLKEKLEVDQADVKTNPASLVDFGRSTVRVVKSWRAGVGKSLYKTRRAQDLKDVYPTNKRTTGAVVSIPLHEKEIDVDTIMARLLECTLPAGQSEPRIFHIDISYEVYIGVDAFLFQLLVLGCLVNSAGYVWIKSPCDHYLVEAMPLLTTDNSKQRGEQICFHRCFDILPDVTCRSPEESFTILQGRKPAGYAESDLLFDQQEFESAVFQRPYQYLRRLDERRGLADVSPYEPEGDRINCLQTFLRHCGVRDPSWAELKHFVCFLNSQLQDFEVSAFCGAAAKEDLPGFDKFVLKFLIQMSRDFATRSLEMSEESPIQRMQRMALVDEETGGAGEENIIRQFQMRRTWESSPHPYLFFNPDHHSMTFVGFKIQRATGDLLDQQTGAVLDRHIMQRELQDSLIRNKVNIDENFDGLQRHEKILKLCSVMGMEMPHDPDDTYELTTDNVKKILAIYMRFKCDIPVIIMGETGCGKTRLVKFMCALQCPPGVDLKNMILMKVHGGTKTKDIIKKVKEAEKTARENADTYGQHIQTVLFFDEANTTEAIGLIKEIMCDRTIGGNQLKLCRSLKIIAACNPYRK